MGLLFKGLNTSLAVWVDLRHGHIAVDVKCALSASLFISFLLFILLDFCSQQKPCIQAMLVYTVW